MQLATPIAVRRDRSHAAPIAATQVRSLKDSLKTVRTRRRVPANAHSKRSDARRAGLACLVPLLVAVGIVRSPWGLPPGPDFYSSAAQIIPVLLVALAVESSARELWQAVAPWVRVYTFVALAAGELAAVVASSGVIANPPADIENLFAGPVGEAALQSYVGPGTVGTDVLLGVTVAGLIVGFLSVMYLAFFQRAPRKRGP